MKSLVKLGLAVGFATIAGTAMAEDVRVECGDRDLVFQMDAVETIKANTNATAEEFATAACELFDAADYSGGDMVKLVLSDGTEVETKVEAPSN